MGDVPASLQFLRNALEVIKTLEKEIGKTLPALHPREQVEMGYLLSGISKHSKRAVEKSKTVFRKVARNAMPSRHGTQILQGGGKERCQVHFPLPVVQIREGVNMDSLKKALGPQFPVFFRISYTPTKDFSDHIKDLDEETRKKLLAAVERSEPTPRVSFDSE